MATNATGPLSDQIKQLPGSSVAGFCAVFDAWKSGFPDTEYSHYMFGKDGAYISPTVDGKKYVLRHVHLPPLLDQKAHAEWLRLYRQGTDSGRWTRRTSNRVLIYATRALPGGGDSHLLMYILTEPDAHEVAAMKTANNRRFMQQFAACAEDFLHDGTISW